MPAVFYGTSSRAGGIRLLEACAISMTVSRLTYTKLSTFKNCHRKYLNRHEKLLVPRVQRQGQRRGGNLGSILFRVQQKTQEGKEFALRPFIVDTVENLYFERHPSSTEEQHGFDIEKVKLIEVSLAYISIYGIDHRREIVYDLPLINPLTGRSMRAFRSAGKIDGIISLGNKHAKIIEDKFVQQIQKVMIDKLPLDDQITEYVDALAHEGWTAEVEYRHTRYPGINPNPPKEYKKKDNYPGETLEEFGERLAADLVGRHSFYFDKQMLMFSTEHLEEYRLHRWMVAKEILERRRMAKRLGDAAWFKNPHVCGDYGGCQFLALCTMQQGAEDLYTVSEIADPELEITHSDPDEDDSAVR